jgi:hypothetical protein
MQQNEAPGLVTRTRLEQFSKKYNPEEKNE